MSESFIVSPPLRLRWLGSRCPAWFSERSPTEQRGSRERQSVPHVALDHAKRLQCQRHRISPDKEAIMAEPIWNRFLTERDKAVFAAAGYGTRAGFGSRPALLVIDVNYNFCGDRRGAPFGTAKDPRHSSGPRGAGTVCPDCAAS